MNEEQITKEIDEIREHLSGLSFRINKQDEVITSLMEEMKEEHRIQYALNNRIEHLEKHVEELEVKIREPKDT
jgi:septal ring factor EnvC (AmiA/AmiB activator)